MRNGPLKGLVQDENLDKAVKIKLLLSEKNPITGDIDKEIEEIHGTDDIPNKDTEHPIHSANPHSSRPKTPGHHQQTLPISNPNAPEENAAEKGHQDPNNNSRKRKDVSSFHRRQSSDDDGFNRNDIPNEGIKHSPQKKEGNPRYHRPSSDPNFIDPEKTTSGIDHIEENTTANDHSGLNNRKDVKLIHRQKPRHDAIEYNQNDRLPQEPTGERANFQPKSSHHIRNSIVDADEKANGDDRVTGNPFYRKASENDRRKSATPYRKPELPTVEPSDYEPSGMIGNMNDRAGTAHLSHSNVAIGNKGGVQVPKVSIEINPLTGQTNQINHNFVIHHYHSFVPPLTGNNLYVKHSVNARPVSRSTARRRAFKSNYNPTRYNYYVHRSLEISYAHPSSRNHQVKKIQQPALAPVKRTVSRQTVPPSIPIANPNTVSMPQAGTGGRHMKTESPISKRNSNSVRTENSNKIAGHSSNKSTVSSSNMLEASPLTLSETNANLPPVHTSFDSESNGIPKLDKNSKGADSTVMSDEQFKKALEQVHISILPVPEKLKNSPRHKKPSRYLKDMNQIN